MSSFEIGVVYKDGVLVPCNETMSQEMAIEFKEGYFYAFKLMKYSDKRKRTLLQNSAIHLYFTKLAKALNAAGWDMRRTLRQEIEIPWDDYLVKNFLWRDLQKAMTDKESTTDLEAHEVGKIYQTLSRHLAQKLGVSVPFPDTYTQSLENNNEHR